MLSASSSSDGDSGGGGGDTSLTGPSDDPLASLDAPQTELPPPPPPPDQQQPQQQYVVPVAVLTSSPSSSSSPVVTSSSLPLAPESLLARWKRMAQWDRTLEVEQFIAPGWSGLAWLTPTSLFVFRLFVVEWSAILWAFSVYSASPNGKFFVYLTNFNQTAVLLYFTAQCIVFFLAARDRTRQRLIEEEESRIQGGAASTPSSTVNYSSIPPLVLHLLYWWHQHCIVWSALVVLVYWAALYPSPQGGIHSSLGWYENISFHGLVLFWMLLDMSLNRLHFVFVHVLYTLLLSVFYLAVNGIYYAITSFVIYNIIDWQTILTPGSILGCILYLLAWYGIGHLMSRQRDRWSGYQEPLQQQQLPGRWCSCNWRR